MEKMNTRKLTLLAMMVALTTVATLSTRIPVIIVPNGYVNLGDTILMFTGLLLGPAAGFVAGSFGSALADLIGFPVYAPFTFVVKGIEGLVCGWIYKKTNHKYAVIATLMSGVLMAAGYFIVESIFFYGVRGAVADIPGNMMQGVANAFLAVLLNRSLSGALKKRISL